MRLNIGKSEVISLVSTRWSGVYGVFVLSYRIFIYVDNY